MGGGEGDIDKHIHTQCDRPTSAQSSNQIGTGENSCQDVIQFSVTNVVNEAPGCILTSRLFHRIM